jgi:hypothetical protein
MSANSNIHWSMTVNIFALMISLAPRVSVAQTQSEWHHSATAATAPVVEAPETASERKNCPTPVTLQSGANISIIDPYEFCRPISENVDVADRASVNFFGHVISSFPQGNLNPGRAMFVLVVPPAATPSTAPASTAPASAIKTRYLLSVAFASKDPRQIWFYLDNVLIQTREPINRATGCSTWACQRLYNVAILSMPPGPHVLEIQAAGPMPYISEIALTPQ